MTSPERKDTPFAPDELQAAFGEFLEAFDQFKALVGKRLDDVEHALREKDSPMTDTTEKPELPLGAIHNGREHFRRLVDHYNFSCEAGALWHCEDFNSAKQCFEFLIEHVESAERYEAALRTQVSVMREALEEVREYFDQRADADQPAGCAAPIPNEEMSLLVTADAALALISNQEAN